MLWHRLQFGGVSRLLALTFAFNTASVQAANLKAVTQFSQLPDVSQESPETDESEEPRFSCELDDGQYTVMYHPKSQNDQAYPWATPTELGGGWTAERRCNEIARRLEFYRSDGLIELGTSVENGYAIVCVTTQADSRCRIVLTVPPGQDPQQTRDLVFENIVTADRGQSTDAISTFGSQENELNSLEQVLGIEFPHTQGHGINLLPFLDPADGGTGEILQENNSRLRNPQLNPDNFR